MPKRTADDTGSNRVGSAGLALMLLTMFQSRRYVRVIDVSRELGVAPSTAHRLLSVFEQFQFVEQASSYGRYAIGTALTEIARSLSRHLDIETILRPHVAALATELNETVHSCVLRGDKVLFLESVECSHVVRAVSRTGRAIPAYATASGKALLAELSDAELLRLFPNEELPRLTRKTIAKRSVLFAELRRIRERGYAMNVSESERDFAACAAVVRDRRGLARASIVVAGPAVRLRRLDPGRFSATVLSACMDASAALLA
jgi:DNA-binding IclR family transcriptional regulator